MSKKYIIGTLMVVVVAGLLLLRRETPTVSPTPSPSVLASPSPTISASRTPTPTLSRTPTPTPSASRIPSPSPLGTPVPSLTPTPTQSVSPSPSSSSSSPTPTPTSTPTPTPGPQTHVIEIRDFAFFPGSLNVKPGDIVRFTNQESFNHSAVHDGGDWQTPILSQNESYNLNTAGLAVGTYRYHCGVHGQSMVGTLRIQN